MKHIVAISGSPRKNGNTNLLMKEFIKGVAKENKAISIDHFSLADMNIHACNACGACEKIGGCIIDDDMNKIYDGFKKCDGVILASPLYFGSISAQTKAMVDRCQMFWASQYVLGKEAIDKTKKRRGFFISTGGEPFHKELFLGCNPVMNLFFKAIGAVWQGSLEIGGTDKVAINENYEALHMARVKGQEFLR